MRRSLLVVSALLLALVPLPVSASPLPEYFPVYDGDQFQAIYQYAVTHVLPNLNQPTGQGAITGDPDVDARIWGLAFQRGYELRPIAGDGLVSVDGVVMQPQAAEAWKGLKAEARAAGFGFVVSSAYRSVTTQRWWFNAKLDGTSDDAIEDALTWYSVPGTSKHHSGYALDFRYADGTFGEFRETPDYAWLAANNFYIPKTYGFIPSYPDDVEAQGPNPEPWEFVWVGVETIRCGAPLDLSKSRFASSLRWIAHDGPSCPGGVTVEELEGLLRRLGPKLESLLRV